MHKLWASTYKELLLLSRDLGGLAILFVMPLVLVVTITLIQDSTFRSINDNKIPILWVDYDKGEVSKNIYEGLAESKSFNIIGKESDKEAKELVFKGKYQLAIVIPANLSSELEKKVNLNVEGLLSKFGLEDETPQSHKTDLKKKEVILYFDPATQMAFKNSIKNGIDKMIFKIETQTIYKAFQSQITDDETEAIFDTESFITFKEITPSIGKNEIIPNSVQHNVPAWTLFAIFFIIVPLSINMVKEKSQGTFVRLRTNPVSYLTVLGGKTVIYLAVCLIQFGLMLGIGVYLFPFLGLPSLDVSGKIPLLFLVALFAGLAAIGLGLLLGTVARTQEQSAPFGATFVVILAALGGVWVPVFIMPKFMQTLSNLSPMNWGLNAFYDVFLRDVGIMDLVPELTLLFLFFVITTAISIVYNERKNAV
ncbi:ABC transporter permease [Arenibacter sp. M-2]|uniref:ABC transporter permease n=1 Tax=Arenibacter sp. M-2 TaxID=3053612 RepID=UPI00257125AE|nr:ABC transporter permease [Arenibacter sp. M-2]MDL5511376.1 ABC transporter permease [Arenibacter sp. M-2]|tara:strand:- start:15498 stop:16766 length:1269 start_codon:yes stop_codon:yes gene_type:complete